MTGRRILIVNMMVPGGDGAGPQYTGEWRDGYELAIALARAGAAVTLLSPSIGKHERAVRREIDGPAERAGVRLAYAPFALNRNLGGLMTVLLSLSWVFEWLRSRQDLIVFKQERMDPGLLALPFLRRRALVLTCVLPGKDVGGTRVREDTVSVYRRPGRPALAADRAAGIALALLERVRPKALLYRWTGHLISADETGGTHAGVIPVRKGVLRYDAVRTAPPGSGMPVPSEGMLLFCGAICLRKGVFDLVDAWKRVRAPGTLWIVGQGTPEMQARLRERIAGDARIRYVGAVGYFQKFSLIARSRAVVLPSLRDHHPSILLEAFSCGVPAVTTRQIAGPVRDGENGLLVDAGDTAALAAAMERLLTDEPGRARLAEAARRSAEEYSWDGAVSRILSLTEGAGR